MVVLSFPYWTDNFRAWFSDFKFLVTSKGISWYDPHGKDQFISPFCIRMFPMFSPPLDQGSLITNQQTSPFITPGHLVEGSETAGELAWLRTKSNAMSLFCRVVDFQRFSTCRTCDCSVWICLMGCFKCSGRNGIGIGFTMVYSFIWISMEELLVHIPLLLSVSRGHSWGRPGKWE